VNRPYLFIFDRVQVIDDHDEDDDFHDWVDLGTGEKRSHTPGAGGIASAVHSPKRVHIMDDNNDDIEEDEEL